MATKVNDRSDQNAVELQEVRITDYRESTVRQSGGFHVTRIRAILLAVAVLVVALLAGLIGHYAFPRNASSSPHADLERYRDAWEQCRSLAAARNTCLSDPDCLNYEKDATPSPNTTKGRKSDIRLPLKVVPVHYGLELIPDIYSSDPENFALSGHVTITVQCTAVADVITLHVNKLIIDGNVTLMEEGPGGGHSPRVQGWAIDKTRQFLLVHLNGLLVVGRRYVLDIRFHGPIRNDLTGLYWSSYTEGGETRYLATTQMQPTDARKTFPCFDEPAVKATYDVTIVRRPHMGSLANANKLKTEHRSDGWEADVYETTLKMSTYLLAFIVCDFRYSEMITTAGTRVRVWSRPDAVEQTNYAVHVGTRTIDFYEKYFDIPFPLRKQDMIAVPDFLIGAMENWGLITYREQGILYRSEVSSASDMQWLVELIVHELAHQWFGNLVTPSWWDDLWLNEGFASYMEYIAMDHLYPEWKMNDQFVVRDLHVSLDIDSLTNSHPIYVPVNDPDEINEIFDRISYLKGASVIRMMNQFLGNGIFTSGLSNYLSDYAYGNANHSNLWEHLTDQAKKSHSSIDVSNIMNTWVRQMGYPLVTMEVKGNRVKVGQQRFLKDPDQPDPRKYTSPYEYKWTIPVTYADDTSPQHIWDNPQPIWLWQNESQKTIGRLNPGARWILGNIGQYGYYRVNYDNNNWVALISQLNNNHTVIPVKNRAQIIDDAINLGRSGYLDQLTGMRATQYLSKEMEYVPWKSALDGLLHIDNMLKYSNYYGVFKVIIFSGSDICKPFRSLDPDPGKSSISMRYMLSKLVPLYDVVGFDYDQATQTHLDKYRRALICKQACYYGHKPCRDQALAVFRQWMRNPDSSVLKADQRSIVFCNAIREGSQIEWDFLYQYYKHTTLAAEALSILHALACSNEPWILNRRVSIKYLHFALDVDKIRRQDGVAVMMNVARNAVGNQLTWNFFRQNWPTIKETWGSGFGRFAEFIEAITVTFNTEFQLQQLIEFRKSHDDLAAGLRAFTQAIEVTKGNIKWVKMNMEKVGQWLQETY
ncbi:hypothetical protein LSH36_704g02028 [Paralvinella palmiformis]|uniref:Aminopeptidase n=1 Tax=Paralvinella palmiformis TaxID=53620 RepID=A0AAD9J2G5_9ANNE|nr:hypothetical protein LSH36_704g02028 [Paralvinella palmiformis]